MYIRIFKILLTVFLALGFSADLMAEPPKMINFEKPQTKEQMKEVRKRIETLKIWKLTETLNLDEKKASILFPALQDYGKKKDGIERDIRKNITDLRAAIRDKEEKLLKGILGKLEKQHKAIQKLNDEERAELKNILTIEQQAKYLIFQLEFNKKIRRIIAEAKRKRSK